MGERRIKWMQKTWKYNSRSEVSFDALHRNWNY